MELSLEENVIKIAQKLGAKHNDEFYFDFDKRMDITTNVNEIIDEIGKQDKNYFKNVKNKNILIKQILNDYLVQVEAPRYHRKIIYLDLTPKIKINRPINITTRNAYDYGFLSKKELELLSQPPFFIFSFYPAYIDSIEKYEIFDVNNDTYDKLSEIKNGLYVTDINKYYTGYLVKVYDYNNLSIKIDKNLLYCILLLYSNNE